MRRIRLLVTLLFAIGVCGTAPTQAAPITHTITFTTNGISDTPFGLTSMPSPLSFEFAVDDSILGGGISYVYEALPGFSLLEPLIVGDATFTGADIQVTPGGRVTAGALTEVYLLARFVDPIEGQRQIQTYFFPAFEWDGADFNPSPPSEFIFGTYSISLGPKPEPEPEPVPEPASLLLFGTGLVGLRAWRGRGQ